MVNDFFQVSIPTTITNTHNLKDLIVQDICDQNSDYKSIATALLASIEVVGISLDDLAKSPWCEHTHVNVTLELRGNEVVMEAWADLIPFIY